MAEQAQPPPPPPESTVDLRAYWGIIVKARWALLATMVVVTTAVAIWTYRQPKIYRASTSLIIETTPPQVLGKSQDLYNQSAPGYWASKEFYETQYQILRSREIARRVVEKLGLDKDLAFLGVSPSIDKEQLKELLPKLDSVGRVAGKVIVSPVKDSKIVNISVEDPVPERTVQLANGIAQAYIDHNLETRLAATRDAAMWLHDQMSTLQKNVERADRDLYEFKSQRNLLAVSIEDQLGMNSARLKSLSETLNKLSIERLALEARRKVMSGLVSGDSRMVLERVLSGKDPLINNLRASGARLKEQLVQLRARYLEKNEKLAIPEIQLKEIQAELQQEVDNALKANEVDYTTVVENHKAASSAFETEKQAAIALSRLSIEYNHLARIAEQSQNLFGLILTRWKEADLSSMLRTNNARQLDPALLPKVPVRPRVQLNLGLGAGIGLALGIGLAFLLEFLDRTIKSQADVEDTVGMPFLGMIPTIPQDEEGGRRKRQREATNPDPKSVRNRDLYIVSHPRSPVAECHRSLRTNITFMSPDRPARRILVTSAGPREGKSTTAVGLAITMAQSGQKTLLLDTDMRRPRLHGALGIPNDRGVSTYVVGECSLTDAIKHTDIPQLDVLPCGPTPPNPAELLHTVRFQDMLAELSERYDRVILDSPPVIAVTDATLLSTYVDGVLLVVKTGRTTKDMLIQTKRRLSDVNANVLGVVLNDLDVRKRLYGYYYYRYYHRYGYYYYNYHSDEKEGAAKA